MQLVSESDWWHVHMTSKNNTAAAATSTLNNTNINISNIQHRLWGIRGSYRKMKLGVSYESWGYNLPMGVYKTSYPNEWKTELI